MSEPKGTPTTKEEIEEAAIEANRKFMQEFATLYQESPEAARHKYYLEKCHFDTSTEEGLSQRKKMMKKYLEGLQWVL